MMLAQIATLLALSGQVDAHYIAGVADSLGVPPIVALAVSWQETRSGRTGNRARGQGILLPNGQRLCREIGRFQMSPCVRWERRLHAPQCAQRYLYRYQHNVRCGILFLRVLYLEQGSWRKALTRYNGHPDYAERALAWIGERSLEADDEVPFP